MFDVLKKNEIQSVDPFIHYFEVPHEQHIWALVFCTFYEGKKVCKNKAVFPILAFFKSKSSL